jgi:hypothetical protein
MKIHTYDLKNGKASRKELVAAAKFFASQLMTPRLTNTLSICIRVTDPEDSVVEGLCTWLDDPYRPKEFSVKIKGGTIKEMLLTLAHEMVHVKQYARGELRDLLSLNKFTVNYKGTRHRLIVSDDPKYMTQPWEVEAFELEEILYNAYMVP